MGCVVWKLYYQHSNLISYLDETKARMNGRKIERISFDVGDDSEKTAEMTKQDHVMQPYFHSLIPLLHSSFRYSWLEIDSWRR
jgi:hypothetical protein